MADDIVKRLRSEMHYRPDSAVIAGAADLIEAQQAEIERLRAVLDAIDALHQPDSVSEMCEQCLFEWPTCPTHLLLHPEEAHRG